MGKITLQNIGLETKKRRGDMGIRETAKEIGISTATLSRIENGKLPDLGTFSKLCRWLGVDGGRILGCSNKEESSDNTPISAHFKADKNLNPKTATALANMIIAAQAMFNKA